MPVTIKKSVLKYKNQNGQYVNVDMAAERPLAEQIAEIEAAGEEVLESIPSDYTELEGRVNDLETDLAVEVQRASGVEADLTTGLAGKINKPTNGNGTAGQILRTDGAGGTSWENAATSAEISAATDNWLEDNITNPSNPPLDRSLSLENAAAPADMVGDLKSAMNLLPVVKESDAEDVDLDVADANGNVIVRFANGHIKTKEFDSSELQNQFAGKQNTLTFDEEPTENSSNPVKSGGVFEKFGAIEQRVQNVENRQIPVDVKVRTTTKEDVDLDITDQSGNVLARLSSGNIETAGFKGYQYVTMSKRGTYTPNGGGIISIQHHFKKGDKVILHIDRSVYPYNMPWNPGMQVSYYADNVALALNKRIDLSYMEYTLSGDAESISAVYSSGVYGYNMNFTFSVSLLGDIPIKPVIVTIKQDGTGDHTTLRSALDAIGSKANDVLNPYRIEIYPGTYEVLDDYTEEEIGSAVNSFNDLTFVGPKLLNGMSLIGVGNPEDIVLYAELSTADWSADVRGGISTLNIQGSGTIENLTIVAKNLRYCCHDDFGYQDGKKVKRVIKNCIFRGFNTAYIPHTTYGAGMPHGGMDAAYIDCDFGECAGLHLNSNLNTPVSIRIENCKGLAFNVGDNVASADASMVSDYYFRNCNFIMINANVADSVPHVRITGCGNNAPMLAVPPEVLYNLDGIVLVPAMRLTANIGDLVEWYSQNRDAPRCRIATALENVSGIIVYKDDSNVYVQTYGYVRTDRTGLTNFALNDYIGFNSGRCVIVQNEEQSLGRIKHVDYNGYGYIKLNWR